MRGTPGFSAGPRTVVTACLVNRNRGTLPPGVAQVIQEIEFSERGCRCGGNKGVTEFWEQGEGLGRRRKAEAVDEPGIKVHYTLRIYLM